VVVAEGVVAEGGEKILLQEASNNHGVERLGGVGQMIGEALNQHIDAETRVVTLGHLQRGGSPTSYDRILASRFGVKAVELIAAKRYGEMVALKGRHVEGVSIASAVARLNRVDPQGELAQTARQLGILVSRR